MGDFNHFNGLGLGKFALIGNPLFIPRTSVEIPLDKEEYNIPSDNYFLEFRKASGGLWLSYDSFIHGLTLEPYFSTNSEMGIKEGSLAKTLITSSFSFLGIHSCTFAYEKTDLDSLLEDKLIKQVSYQEAFENLEILNLFESELAKIPDKKNFVFQVQEGCSGRISVRKYFGGKKPEEKNSIYDTIKEKLGNLFPEPLKQPVYLHNS